MAVRVCFRPSAGRAAAGVFEGGCPVRTAVIGARDVFDLVGREGGAYDVRCVACGGRAAVPGGAQLALLVHADACQTGGLMRACPKPLLFRVGGRMVAVEHETKSRLA
jgi:hypothetical protein